MVEETISKQIDDAFIISKEVTGRLMRELVDVIKECIETLDQEWNEKASKTTISNPTTSPLSYLGIINRDIRQVDRLRQGP